MRKTTPQRLLERIYEKPFEELFPEVRERTATAERAAAELDCSVTTVRAWDEWMNEFNAQAEKVA